MEYTSMSSTDLAHFVAGLAVSGLGNWTYLQGEMPEPNYTEANLDYERSILRVSPEELPAIFHYPMGNSHIGSTLDDPTLASRFANWT
eukprot:2485247-Rhodomonas_salina.6